MEKIKKIIIGTLDGVWQEATIVDEKNNVNLIEDKNDIINLLSQFAIESSSEITALLNDKEKVVKVEMNSEDYANKVKSLVEMAKNEQVEVTAALVNPSEENTKKKKGKIKFRYIAAGAVLIGVLVGGASLIRYGIEEIKRRSVKNNKSYTQTYNNSFTVTRHDNSANDIFNATLDRTYANVDSFISQVSQIKNRVYTEDEINEIINKINMMAVSSVTELENVLKGQKMSGNNYSQSHESYFDKGTSEYVAVGEFTTLRNDIINNAYSKTTESVQKNIINFIDYLNRFVFDIEPIVGTDIYFSNLDQVAKYNLFAFGKAFIQIVEPNYSINLYNNNYSKEQLMDLYEIWCGQSYEMILNNYATKRR